LIARLFEHQVEDTILQFDFEAASSASGKSCWRALPSVVAFYAELLFDNMIRSLLNLCRETSV
jgi:hypothetical protein